MVPMADGHVAVLRKNKMTRETMIRRRCARAGAEWKSRIVVQITYLKIIYYYFIFSLSLFLFIYRTRTRLLCCAREVWALVTICNNVCLQCCTYRIFACVEYFHFCENAIECHVVSVQQVYT